MVVLLTALLQRTPQQMYEAEDLKNRLVVAASSVVSGTDTTASSSSSSPAAATVEEEQPSVTRRRKRAATRANPTATPLATDGGCCRQTAAVTAARLSARSTVAGSVEGAASCARRARLTTSATLAASARDACRCQQRGAYGCNRVSSSTDALPSAATDAASLLPPPSSLPKGAQRIRPVVQNPLSKAQWRAEDAIASAPETNKAPVPTAAVSGLLAQPPATAGPSSNRKQPTLVELLTAGVERPPNGPPRLRPQRARAARDGENSATASPPPATAARAAASESSYIVQLLRCPPPPPLPLSGRDVGSLAWMSTPNSAGSCDAGRLHAPVSGRLSRSQDANSSNRYPQLAEADSSNLPLDADLLTEFLESDRQQQQQEERDNASTAGPSIAVRRPTSQAGLFQATQTAKPSSAGVGCRSDISGNNSNGSSIPNFNSS